LHIKKVGDCYYVQIWLCGDLEHKPPHVKLVHVFEDSLEDESKLSRELVTEILEALKTGEKKIGDMFYISESFRDEVEKLLPKANLFA
jgi:hypothetical protein